ncbi:MAG: T9SS type A sorting domain-containing protein [Bacteroidia bacterium]|nr:T9SS type A sorting domain-containing protein [Bacteroidia bacterium]
MMMKKKSLILVVLSFAIHLCNAQPTSIYKPNGTSTTFGRATNDSLDYYVNLGYSPFTVVRIDKNNQTSNVCDLPATTNQMIFNSNKGIYKMSSGYFLYNGSTHTAIPSTLIPISYPFNNINENFFHIGNSSYFENDKCIFKTDYSSISNIQTLYTAAASNGEPSYYAIATMYHVGNYIFFTESGNPLTPTPNLLKKINLLTLEVATVDTLASGAFGMPMILHNETLYYTVGSGSKNPFGIIKKADKNGNNTVLYSGTNAGNTILGLLGITPKGLIGYTLQNELMLLSGGTTTSLNHHISASPLPRTNYPIGKSTQNLVYFQALDSIQTTGPAENALWVTDGTLLGTKKIISKSDYYSGAASFEYGNSIISSVVCGDNLYFTGQKSSTSQLTLNYVNASNNTFQIYSGIISPNQIFKNPMGGIYLKSSPALGQFAVYRGDCNITNHNGELFPNISNFNVFPNPSNGQIEIEWEGYNTVAELSVYNTLGELVGKHRMFGNRTPLELNLKSGLYILTIEMNGQISSNKILIN